MILHIKRRFTINGFWRIYLALIFLLATQQRGIPLNDNQWIASRYHHRLLRSPCHQVTLKTWCLLPDLNTFSSSADSIPLRIYLILHLFDGLRFILVPFRNSLYQLLPRCHPLVWALYFRNRRFVDPVVGGRLIPFLLFWQHRLRCVIIIFSRKDHRVRVDRGWGLELLPVFYKRFWRFCCRHYWSEVFVFFF